MRNHIKSLGVLTTGVIVALFSMPLRADVVKLWRVSCDDGGTCTFLFSVLDDDQAPIGDAQNLLSDIRLEAGPEFAEMTELELGSVRIQTLETSQLPFQIHVLLPSTDLFNGVEGEPSWPDVSGLRSAVIEALRTLPQQQNITLQIGMYNDDITWLSEVDTTQIEEISATLLNTDYATPRAYPEARIEDPFGAIDATYRTELRRQAREPGRSDFVHFFVMVTSSQSPVAGTEQFDDAVDEYREVLDNRGIVDVIPLFIVFDPAATDVELSDPEGEHQRFAQGIVPDRGPYRFANSEERFRRVIQETVEQVTSSFVLVAENNPLGRDLVGGTAYTRLSFDDGQFSSNAIQHYVRPPHSHGHWPNLRFAVVVLVISSVLFLVLALHRFLRRRL